MPVQEFECQIAQGQIGRYLNGDGLSSETLRQLGLHVAECAVCKSFLDQRKSVLQGMLGEEPIAATPAREPKSTAVAASGAVAVVKAKPTELLMAQLRARARAEREPEQAPAAETRPRAALKPMLGKPVMFCGALAAVLVGMTYISHDPSAFLGPRAAGPAEAPVATTRQPSSPAAVSPAPVVSPAAVSPAPVATPAAAHSAATPQPGAPAPVDSPATSSATSPSSSASSAGPIEPAPAPSSTGAASSSAPPPLSPAKASPAPARRRPATRSRRRIAGGAGRRAWLRPRPGTGTIHVYPSR